MLERSGKRLQGLGRCPLELRAEALRVQAFALEDVGSRLYPPPNEHGSS